MSLANTLILTTLTSGNAALYEVQPQHLNRQHFVGPEGKPQPLGEIARRYGEQLAHELNGTWYEPGGWKPIPGFKVPAGVARA